MRKTTFRINYEDSGDSQGLLLNEEARSTSTIALKVLLVCIPRMVSWNIRDPRSVTIWQDLAIRDEDFPSWHLLGITRGL